MKVTDDQIAEALHKSGGVQKDAADLLGVSASTVHARIKKSAELTSVYEQEKRVLVSMAHGVIFKKIKDGNQRAAEFVLRTLGKDEWSSKVEVEAQVGNVTRVVLQYPDDGRDPNH